MKVFRIIASALSAILLSIAFAAFVTYLTTPEEDRPDIIELAESFDADGEQERTIDWDSLPSEVIAWVEVPGTSIDEPIVQATPDEPNAYLYEDVLERGAYGTPYIDCECTLESPFVMIYGHHMSDGSAFADFASFVDETYAREHDEIIFYKRTGEMLELHPVAVDIVNASRENLVIDQMADYKEIVSGSDLLIRGPGEDDQLFAFTTCSYQTKNSRTIVFAGTVEGPQ